VLGLSYRNDKCKLCLKSNGQQYREAHIVYSMVYWEDQRGTLEIASMVQKKHGKVAFYHMDSLSNFDNSTPYALSSTLLYSQNRDSWHNMTMERRTELECGMVLCLGASMIAQ
jgi:hypothetical protein